MSLLASQKAEGGSIIWKIFFFFNSSNLSASSLSKCFGTATDLRGGESSARPDHGVVEPDHGRKVRGGVLQLASHLLVLEGLLPRLVLLAVGHRLQDLFGLVEALLHHVVVQAAEVQAVPRRHLAAGEAAPAGAAAALPGEEEKTAEL